MCDAQPALKMRISRIPARISRDADRRARQPGRDPVGVSLRAPHALLLAACASLASLWAGRALAAGEYARLRYELDDPGGKCANEASFRARVVSRLGYDPFREEASLDLHVHVVARGPTVRAEITSAQPGKPSGKRTLEDPRCDALGETLASAVALVLDPVAAAGAPPVPAPSPAPLPAPPPAVTETHPVAETPPRAPASSASLVPLIYADFTTGFARAPATLVGGRIGVGLRRGSFSIAAEGHAETSPSAASVAPSDRVEASAFSGALVPCGHVDMFELCAVVTLGAREVKALDVVRPQAQSALFVVLGVRAGIEVPLSGAIALRAHGELGVPLLRTTYTIDGIARSTTGLVDASLGAGILGRFR